MANRTNRANRIIREFAKDHNVRLWQIADELNTHESNVSRMLRHELSAEDKARIMSIILQISGEEAKEIE